MDKNIIRVRSRSILFMLESRALWCPYFVVWVTWSPYRQNVLLIVQTGGLICCVWIVRDYTNVNRVPFGKAPKSLCSSKHRDLTIKWITDSKLYSHILQLHRTSLTEKSFLEPWSYFITLPGASMVTVSTCSVGSFSLWGKIVFIFLLIVLFF